MELKKKHHYVWKNYLRNWSNVEYINTYFIDSKKIIKTNLINIAQEKLFYRLEKFSDLEKEQIEFLLNDHCEKAIIPAAKELLKCFYLYTDFSQDAFYKLHKSDEFLNFIKHNTIEEILTGFESYGKNLINIQNVTDLHFLKDKKELSTSLLFLTTQYTRTKNIKDKLNNALKKYDLIYNEKFWILMSFIYALNLTYYLTEKFKSKIIVYNNTSDLNFITSDQPAFNSNQENKDQNGHVTGFDLFYAINPKVAIKFICNKDSESFEIQNINKDEVIEINKLIFEFSYKNIFFVDENDTKSLSF